MLVEDAQLTADAGAVVLSSNTVVRGMFDASIRRFALADDATDTSNEAIAIREFIRQLAAHDLGVGEVLHITLADSTSTFLHVTVSVSSNAPVVGVIAQHDWVRPRFALGATAAEDGAHRAFTIEADRSTSSARAAWVATLVPLGGSSIVLGDESTRALSPIIAGTLGMLTAPASEARESGPPPTRARPPVEEAAAAPPPLAPPPRPSPAPMPPPQAVPMPAPVGAEPSASTGTRRTRGRRTRSTSPAPSEALPELSVSRRPEIEFADVMAAGDKRPLVLRLHEESILEAITNAFAVVIGKGKESVQLAVTLSAPGFIVEPREQPITVGRSYDAKVEQATFMLTAQEPTSGEPVTRDIRADIWSGNASIGGVTFMTTVTPKGWKGKVDRGGQSRAVSFDTTPSGRECELVIRVEGKDDHGSPPFQVSARLRIPGEPEVESKRLGTISFTRTELASMLTDQFASFAERFPADGDAAALKAWRADLLDEVDTLGKWLWTQLPDEFRNEYFRLQDAGRSPGSILVHSDEMLIPWELIVPHRQGKVLPRLGAAHVMGRWRPALGMRPRPQSLTVTAAAIANPKYQDAGFLIWSLLEAADLTQAVPAFTKMPVVDKAAMKKMLDRTDVQLLHFTGHGRYARHADLSTLLLENGDTITAMHFIGSKLLEKGHPIIYLNACEVGTSGVTMGQMGGFAAQCVEGGCSGIIAPYWAVSDDSAREFAVAFYGHLKAGKAIGEALQALRKSKPRDPTYQAFAYLGDPWTQARFT